ncbi:hypothetical protein QA601_03030 [Chitinispirillales bacterium ANBcel5]|uniref:hypothetical protein n=1 Tax=Cellulosispirillum alkaliphilum TaxID=3039283 RepID=UPI002A544AED|nr:hypothetical protein [Chitinispirillales bacterium ANBcel5]
MHIKMVFILIVCLFASVYSSQTDSQNEDRSKIIQENNDEEEEEEPQRVFNTVGVGPAGLGSLDSDNLAVSAYYGSMLIINPYVNGRFLLELTTDVTDAVFSNFELGVDIFLADAFLAPYFGIGLGGGFARGAEENVFGLTVSTQAGLIIFRNASLQFDLHGKLHLMLNEIDPGFPHVYSLRLGVLF